MKLGKLKRECLLWPNCCGQHQNYCLIRNRRKKTISNFSIWINWSCCCCWASHWYRFQSDRINFWCVGLWFPFNHVQTTLMNYNYNLKKKRTDKIKWMIKHTTFNFSIKMFIWFLVHILFVRCTRLFLLFRIFYELILFFMVEIIFLLCWCS